MNCNVGEVDGSVTKHLQKNMNCTEKTLSSFFCHDLRSYHHQFQCLSSQYPGGWGGGGGANVLG